MQKQISPKIVALTFGVLVISFLAGFYVIAWTEPSEDPPFGNIPAPINVSTTTQYKAGALGIGGILQAYSNIVDSAANIIYNDSTKKIERARLPFEQGDITSDVDTNTWDVGYYNVANLAPGNVATGIAFGRNQVGALAGSVSTDIAAAGVLGWNTNPYVYLACYATCPTTPSNYAVIYPAVLNTNSEYDPRGILNVVPGSTIDCWTTYLEPCTKQSYIPQSLSSYSLQCASGWVMDGAVGSQGPNLITNLFYNWCSSYLQVCFSATCRQP